MQSPLMECYFARSACAASLDAPSSFAQQKQRPHASLPCTEGNVVLRRVQREANRKPNERENRRDLIPEKNRAKREVRRNDVGGAWRPGDIGWGAERWAGPERWPSWLGTRLRSGKRLAIGDAVVGAKRRIEATMEGCRLA
ncbi:hypothetical protein GUJ93_ZPchr0004g40534 [Zizania palustris]|uniref:Uncharacterized protein n=1 Tax=Zizania palustris TaxID=103762 RepID=A0A8J5SCK5_ZIZPA|nr:hypothetical protein GUJ93_ZPchr0004g40534 [Zizania palustris]